MVMTLLRTSRGQAPLHAARTRRSRPALQGVLATLGATVIAAHAAPAPDMDCKSARSSSVDAAVCASPVLTRLDRETRRLYALATATAGASANAISAGQGDWLAQRDACVSRADAAKCLRERYLSRIAAIRSESTAARSGARGLSLGPFEFRCPGPDSGVFRITYANVDPSLAFVTAGGTSYVLTQARSGSGARYEGEGALFWEYQGEARWRAAVDGVETTCKRVATG
jgi:uncharacterized protein